MEIASLAKTFGFNLFCKYTLVVFQNFVACICLHDSISLFSKSGQLHTQIVAISLTESILTRLESYDGVNRTEAFVTTKLVYYQEWLKREIDKRLEESEEEEVAAATPKDYIIEMH
jgi:hypothetical protein